MIFTFQRPNILLRKTSTFIVFLLLVFSFFSSLKLNAAENLANSQNIESFKVADIEVEGLVRISLSQVLMSIDLKIGEQFNLSESSRIIDQLFETGWFDDIVVGAKNGILIISVVERPILLEIEFTGNEKIKSDDLTESLRQMGLIKGQVVSKALLSRTENEIKTAYHSIGYYNADVQIQTFPESRNRVMVRVAINENDQSKITSIRFFGNNFFSQKKLLAQMNLDTGGVFSFITESNVFSQQKLSADLEKIKSFYLNQGFADFKITNHEINLSADKKQVSIFIEIDEGMQYKIGSSTFDLIDQFPEIANSQSYSSNEVFNFEKIEDTSFEISKYLADFGYAFAVVEPEIVLNENDFLANIHYGIFLNQKMYVNRIEISGNSHTNDRVIRRELDLLEGSVFNKNKLDTSVRNLNRLGYFENVDIDFERTVNSDTEVDLKVKVTETLTGNYSFGVSYSDEVGIGTSLGVKERNFIGGGYEVNADVFYSKSTKDISINVSDPFFTENRQSVSAGVFYSEYDANSIKNSSSYQIDQIGASIGYGIPLSEEDQKEINLKLIFSKDKLNCSSLLAANDINGEKTQCNNYKSTNTYSLSVFWTNDTKDAFFFPTEGIESSIGLSANLPFSTLNEYTLSNSFSYYKPVEINDDTMVLKANYNLAFVDSYDGKKVAFYNRYYLGGSRTLRGFAPNSIGPKYQNGSMKGGAFKVSGGFAAIFKIPFVEDSSQMRLSPFIDIGNVYESISRVSLSDLRMSGGVAFSWLTPVGPLSFSWASPIVKKSIDISDTFQFSLGTAF